MQISRDNADALEAPWHRLATWRAAKVDPGGLCDVAAETLKDVVADLRAAAEADRQRAAVAETLAGLDARMAQTVAERARVFNVERGTQ